MHGGYLLLVNVYTVSIIVDYVSHVMLSYRNESEHKVYLAW